MNLKTLIRSELWQEISNSYEAENYKNAILDAMHFLSTILREKTSIDSDGVSLVGQSLGGDQPKLRINKLQTESERDEQKGFMQILQGFYTGIRNPRSHEQIIDTKNYADPIIYFIDYICDILGTSKPPFTLDEFFERAFDPDFVEHERYAELLGDEIPPSKMCDFLIQLYRNKSRGEAKKIKYISRELISRLSDTDMDQFLAVVSEELTTVTEHNDITATFQMIPNEYWPRIKEAARMRIENKLINSIKVGEAILNSDQIRDGALGTWAKGRVEYFTLKTELRRVIRSKLTDDDVEDNLYVIKYFLSELPSLFTSKSSIKICVEAMKRVVLAEDQSMKSRIYNFLIDCSPEWKDLILDNFRELTDTDFPEFVLSDGTPFLGKTVEPPSDDDIPF